jgi:hypothetical protein
VRRLPSDWPERTGPIFQCEAQHPSQRAWTNSVRSALISQDATVYAVPRLVLLGSVTRPLLHKASCGKSGHVPRPGRSGIPRGLVKRRAGPKIDPCFSPTHSSASHRRKSSKPEGLESISPA